MFLKTKDLKNIMLNMYIEQNIKIILQIMHDVTTSRRKNALKFQS